MNEQIINLTTDFGPAQRALVAAAILARPAALLFHLG
jgi:hypothetical protein